MTEAELLKLVAKIRTDPIESALDIVAEALANKDTSVAVKIIDLDKRYGIAAESDKRPEHLEAERYRHLPVEAAEMSYRLECGVGETVRRYERGLPCADHEILLAKAAISVRDNNGKSAETARLKQLAARVVKLLDDSGIRGWMQEAGIQ